MPKLNQVYGIGQALIPVLPPPLGFENAPTSAQTNYEIGQVVYTPAKNPTAFYMYAGGGVWDQFIGSSGTVLAVDGTANEITASTTSGVVTLSLPSAITAPGSLTTTTTLAAGTTLSAGTTITAGTGITATTGNIVATAGNITTTAGSITSATTLTATLGNVTATNGNFVASTAGNGLVLPVATGSGAASGSVTCNGRQGSCSFTSPSIAGGAVLTLTMGNSSITGSSTLGHYSLRGATTGAALCIQSVTNSAGSSAVVVNNGTGATTQTGTITLDFIVLN